MLGAEKGQKGLRRYISFGPEAAYFDEKAVKSTWTMTGKIRVSHE
jgi:hypothetical protein